METAGVFSCRISVIYKSINIAYNGGMLFCMTENNGGNYG